MIKKIILGFLVFCVSGCAPQVGLIIDAPEIPLLNKPEIRARLGSYVNVDKVQDSRVVGQEQSTESGNTTEPYSSDIPSLVRSSLQQALSDVGVSSNESAPLVMEVEIKKWKSEVGTKSGSGKIESEATLFIELFDPTGKRLFSGTYTGQRSSSFPIVSKIDIKDSLGLAMANAIEQIVTDQEFLNILGSHN